VNATNTDKRLDSMPRNDAVAELCIGKFNVTYCHVPMAKPWSNISGFINIVLENFEKF
jgi:hypothetical protein